MTPLIVQNTVLFCFSQLQITCIGPLEGFLSLRAARLGHLILPCTLLPELPRCRDQVARRRCPRIQWKATGTNLDCVLAENAFFSNWSMNVNGKQNLDCDQTRLPAVWGVGGEVWELTGVFRPSPQTTSTPTIMTLGGMTGTSWTPGCSPKRVVTVSQFFALLKHRFKRF